MNLFLRLFGSSREGAINNTADLRRALFDSIKNKNEEKLKALCFDNRVVLIESFGGWKKIPKNVNMLSSEVDYYGKCLVKIAKMHGRICGDSVLMDLLRDGGSGNSLAEWQGKISDVKLLIGENEYALAAEILENAIIDGVAFVGDGANALLSQSWGTLGYCSFKQGKLVEAAKQTEKAVEICQSRNDVAGAKIYLKSLCQICTQMGRMEDAARYACELLRL